MKNKKFQITSIILLLSLLFSCGAEVTPHSYEKTAEVTGNETEVLETEDKDIVTLPTEEPVPPVVSDELYEAPDIVTSDEVSTPDDDAVNERHSKYIDLDYMVIHCQVGTLYTFNDQGIQWFLYDYKDNDYFFRQIPSHWYGEQHNYYMYMSRDDLKSFVDSYKTNTYPMKGPYDLEYTNAEYPKSALNVYKEILADEDFFDKYVLVYFSYTSYVPYDVLRVAKNASNIDTDLKILMSKTEPTDEAYRSEEKIHPHPIFYTFLILPKEAYTGERSKDGDYFIYSPISGYIYDYSPMKKYVLEDFLYDKVNTYDPNN